MRRPSQFAIAFHREQRARKSLAGDPGGRAVLWLLMSPLLVMLAIAYLALRSCW